MVEGQSAVAGRNLREVLQRRVGTHRSGPGAESLSAHVVPPVLAGIAIGAVTTAVWMDRENAWRRWSDWAEERIRELEARVAELEHDAIAMCMMCGKRGIGFWNGNIPGPRCYDHAPTRWQTETNSWKPFAAIEGQGED
jgi:hypothetical protein